MITISWAFVGECLKLHLQPEFLAPRQQAEPPYIHLGIFRKFVTQFAILILACRASEVSGNICSSPRGHQQHQMGENRVQDASMEVVRL